MGFYSLLWCIMSPVDIRSAKQIGRLLRSSREAQSANLNLLSKRCGLSVAQLVHIENGNLFAFESDLEKMMEWIGSADLLIGSRWVKDGKIANWSKFREYLSKSANAYANLLLSLGVKDTTAGFRIYTSALLKKMEISTIRSEGYCFQIEMTRRAISRGGSVAEIPITFIERAHGVSKMSFAIALEAVLRITAWGALRLIGR